jgi:3-(3-hydroxy-phenyl)propionate hydroxylase
MGATTLRVSQPELVRWLRARKADTVVLRPDGFVYTASRSGRPLTRPPAGLRRTDLTGAPA